MKRFLVRYVLDDGTASFLQAVHATSTFAAIDVVQRLFGVRLRYTSARLAAH